MALFASGCAGLPPPFGPPTESPFGTPTASFMFGPPPPPATPPPHLVPTLAHNPELVNDPDLILFMTALADRGVIPLAVDTSQNEILRPAPGLGYRLDQGQLHVHVYPTAADAHQRAPQARAELAQSIADWIGTPHLFECGRLLAMYFGDDHGELTAVDEACVISQPAATPGAPTEPPLSPTSQVAPVALTNTPVASLGEAYLLLRTSTPPYRYQYAYGPVECLVYGTDCLRWQAIPTLPGPNFAPGSNTPLHWSPDGALALLYNPNTMELFSFNPATQAAQLIATDINFLTDEFFWSPDGKLAAAAVQGESAYSSYVAVVDPASGTVEPLRAEWREFDSALELLSLTRMQYPVGWLSANELLVYSELNEPDSISDPLSPKKTVVEGGLYRLNIDTGTLQVLSRGPDWLQRPSASPRGDLLAVPGVSANGTNTAWVRAMAAPETDRFQLPSGSAHWSPDGAWLASTEGQAGSYTIHVTGSDGTRGQHFQQTGDYYAVYWLPDSLHVLVVQSEISVNGNADRTSLVILSIRDGTTQTIDIPALNAQQWVVAGFSWRPTASPASP